MVLGEKKLFGAIKNFISGILGGGFFVFFRPPKAAGENFEVFDQVCNRKASNFALQIDQIKPRNSTFFACGAIFALEIHQLEA